MSYHIAIIPDGNRRWAEAQDMPAAYGHKAGAERAEDLPQWLDDLPVDELTLWGLSVDNANRRSETEINHLNETFRRYGEKLNRPNSTIHEDKIQVNIVGDTSVLYDETRDALEQLEADTTGYEEGTFNVALGYDGRWDIVQAADKAREAYGEVSRDGVEEFLTLPEIDIVVGYGPDREHLSHLANWQTGYATIRFPHKHWPDAVKDDIEEAIAVHKERSKTRGQ